MPDLPLLGAAMAVESLEAHIDWLVHDQRDLELQSFVHPDVVAGDWRTPAAHAKALLGSYRGRLGIHGPFRGFSIATEDREVREVVKRRLMQGLDICEDLGATQMVLHSPYRGWDLENLANLDDGPVQLLARVRASMDDAVARAERLGVELVLENTEDRDPVARVDLARAFESVALKVSIDTGHAFYANRIGHAPAVDRFIRAAGDMLAHLHLQDADGFADRHWPIGDGTTPWRAVFAELAKLNTSPRLIIEIRDKTQIERSARFLEALGVAR